MANALAFHQSFNATINQFIQVLNNLETLQDRLASDPGLAAAAAAAAQAQGRADLSAADFTNAAAAITQIVFTFNSGNPAQKSFLYKML